METTWVEKTWQTRTSWMRSVLAELQDLGYSLGQAQHVAKERVKWWELVAALCPNEDEEDRLGKVRKTIKIVII